MKLDVMLYHVGVCDDIVYYIMVLHVRLCIDGVCDGRYMT